MAFEDVGISTIFVLILKIWPTLRAFTLIFILIRQEDTVYPPSLYI